MRAALEDGRRSWSAASLEAAVDATAVQLTAGGTRVLATLLENSAAFVILDEAALRAGVVHVPLPPFFTPAQIRHALQTAGVDTLIAAAEAPARWPGLPWTDTLVGGERQAQARIPVNGAALLRPAGTVKVTFTSGTTGTPKGVCLTAPALQDIVRSLVSAMAPLDIGRHLNALPFAVLLENVAGLMAPRARGATCVTLPLQTIGLAGSSSFDAARFQAAVALHRPHSIILLPQMLRAWCAHLSRSGERAPASLRIVAVGGAAVGAPLIRLAESLGIPACEGYGLSEGGSVQTLNLPGASLAGSAGRALPHARLRVAAHGEIEVAGSLFAGYLGDPEPVPGWWPTGDLGRIDADGFLHVMGSSRHVLITSFGRNVSPEWVETALRGAPAIAQAVVFGDGQPALGAVLWPTDPTASDHALQAAVDASNATLPDYARVTRWMRGRAAFDAASGMATPNGRPRRPEILHLHAELSDPTRSSPQCTLEPLS